MPKSVMNQPLGCFASTLLLGAIAGGFLIFFPICFGHASNQTPAEKAIESRDREDAIRKLEELKSKGAIYSYDFESEEVRIPLSFWLALDVNEKTKTVSVLSGILKSGGRTGLVTVRSDVNDKELASVSAFSGVTIRE